MTPPMKRLLFALPLAMLLAAASPVHAANDGDLVKASGPAVYYLAEGKRFVFPNERVYFSWYADFSQVRQISDAELASYALGGNVTYKPGGRLIKLQTDPKVYAVARGGKLRWIATEEAARDLYGSAWNRQIDDVSDAYFVDYRIEEPIASAGDFDRAGENAVAAIMDDLAARGPAKPPQTFTAVRLGTWTDGATWGGTRPTTGASVIIPPGIKVIYDAADSGSLKSLDVRGELEFWPEASPKLNARLITVSGKLTIGTEAAPFPANRTATILLTGSAGTDPGDDGLRVNGGTLDLHGAPVGSAWTRLAEPARKDDDRIALEAPVPWPVGAEIAIASTSPNPANAETRRIAQVKGATLVLDRPLEKDHRADGSERAEVALLSRNVVVSGIDAQKGSYVALASAAVARVENVEFRKLGRAGVERNRAISFDGVLAGTNSYLKSNAIHATGNGCVSVRQTDGLRIEGNAAFDVSGRCFDFVDGAEIGTLVSGNLVANLKAGTEAAPAAFRVRNPDNRVVGNAVAVSAGHAYWYDLPESAARNDGRRLLPRETALGAFSGNRSRGTAGTALYVDGEGSKINYAPPQKAVFSGLAASQSGERGFWLRGINLEVNGAALEDNVIGGTFAAFAGQFKDSVVTGGARARYGFTFYDGPVSVSGVTFRDFGNDEEGLSAAFGFHEASDRLPDPRNGYRDVTFVKARPWRAPEPVTAGDRLAIARDVDAGTVVTARSPFLDQDCEHDDDAGVSTCSGKFATLTVALRSAPPNATLVAERLGGGGKVTLEEGPSFDGEYAYLPVAEGASYKLSMPAIDSLAIDYDGAERPVSVRFRAGPGVQVREGGSVLASGTPDALSPGGWAYDAAKGEVVILAAPGATYDVSW